MFMKEVNENIQASSETVVRICNVVPFMSHAYIQLIKQCSSVKYSVVYKY